MTLHPARAPLRRVLLEGADRALRARRAVRAPLRRRRGGPRRAAELWPMASIPVLVDDATGSCSASRRRSSSTSTASATRRRSCPPTGRGAAGAALGPGLDGQVATPMQKIVGDELRPEDGRDPEGVAQARAQLDRVYALLDDAPGGGGLGWPGDAFTLADCAAAPGAPLRPRRAPLGRGRAPAADALLRGADGAAVGGAGDRRGPAVPGGLPAAVAGVGGLARSGDASAGRRVQGERAPRPLSVPRRPRRSRRSPSRATAAGPELSAPPSLFGGKVRRSCPCSSMSPGKSTSSRVLASQEQVDAVGAP